MSDSSWNLPRKIRKIFFKNEFLDRPNIIELKIIGNLFIMKMRNEKQPLDEVPGLYSSGGQREAGLIFSGRRQVSSAKY